MKITKQHAAKVLAVVDKGLVYGLGEPIPGQMCGEAGNGIGDPHKNPDAVCGNSIDGQRGA